MLYKKNNILLLLILITSIISPFYQVSGQIENIKELKDAELKIESAFIAVQKAEKAGVNVKILANTLDSLIQELSTAQKYYHYGNTRLAISKAVQISSTAIKVEATVTNYTRSTLQQAETDFRNLLIYTISALIITIVIFYAAWKLFRKRFTINSLSLKPEVTTDESR